MEKVPHKQYICEHCHYDTSHLRDFKKHLTTSKHIRNSNGTEKVPKNGKNLLCNNCNKRYSTPSGLWKHSQLCNVNEIVDYKDLLITALKQNKELQDFLIKQSEQHQKTLTEMMPKIGNNIQNNNNITTKLSIKLFLNEQCKDAITMDSFLDSIKISLQDLLYTRSNGLANGLSNILIENLNKLPITLRPIHCTDSKRETIYIKNEKWEKDEDQTKTKAAIKKASGIQIKNIHKYKDAKPNCMNIEREKDEYMEVIKATTDDVTEIENKIIKSLCKTVYISENII
jgi:hypothetical protein